MDLFSPALVKSIMPNVAEKRLIEGFDYLIAAMSESEITSVRRMAAFLAQLAHESGELRYFEELNNGSAYEGRKDLGNVNPGDGPKFKGRGPIQLTGRSNYAKAGLALGADLLEQPELAATSQYGYRIATWFWTSHAMNLMADCCDFDAITQTINGGQNGRKERIEYYLRALRVLATARVTLGIPF